jgi:hypothetical protein
MKQLGLQVQEALDWIGRLHDEYVSEFLAAYHEMMAELSETDDEDNANAISYVDSLGNWIRANDQWSFEVR